jgi:hypothetical protein
MVALSSRQSDYYTGKYVLSLQPEWESVQRAASGCWVKTSSILVEFTWMKIPVD